MTIESLKEQARRHEQDEEWINALDLYLQAIDRQSEEDEPDIALYNRVGDLQIRLGDVGGAVENYETAIQLYRDAELPSNAIAVCRKIIRHDPQRPSPFLRMGQIRASQGFMVDARQNFLTYAEMKQAAGETDEAVRALEEFVELAPTDIDTRLFLADQMVARDRSEDAVALLEEAYRLLAGRDEEEAAGEILERIRAIEPGRPAPSRELPDNEPEGADRAEEPDATEPGDLVGFESTSLAEDTPVGEMETESAVSEDAGHTVAPEDTEETIVPETPAGFESTLEAEVSPDEVELGEVRDVEGLEHHAGSMSPGESEADPEEPSTESPSWLESSSVESESEEVEDLPGIDGIEELEGIAGLELEEDGGAEIEEGHDPLPLLGEDEPEPEQAAAEAPAYDDGAPDPEAREIVDVGFGAEEADAVDEGDPLSDLRGRVERDPSDAQAWRHLGEALYEDGDEAAGRDALERAHEAYAEAGDPEKAMRVVRELLIREPDRLDLRRRIVEYAHRTEERTLLVQAFLELAEGLRAAGESQKAEAVYLQVLTIDPSNLRAREAMGRPVTGVGSKGTGSGQRSSSGDYVDLGSMVLDSDGERTTRWVVPAELPSGDEEADFSRMLSQFKEKVADNIASDDVESHYDLGTAFKEMGLLDEAIGEFQQALRARPENLATFEMLGQCFLEKGEPKVAIRTLERGTYLDPPVQDDLLGIFYFLARAHEEVGNTDAAREFYEKVFSLDINFRDVTERLRDLR